MSSDCIFCRIVADQIPAAKVYEDDHVIAFNDIAPIAPVHVLIIPKKHVASVQDLREEDEALVGRLFAAARTVAKEKGIDESGFRISTNSGKDAGQVVFHLHFHLLGGKALGRLG